MRRRNENRYPGRELLCFGISICNIDIPVSYTHLDVYKRQELDLSNEPVAWNTFGYAYRAVNSTNKSTITVEPAKVGVRIPTASLAVCLLYTSDLFS